MIMSEPLDPVEHYNQQDKLFRDALTKEQLELFLKVQNAKEKYNTFQHEKGRPERVARENAKREAEELAKAKAIEAAVSAAHQREVAPKIIQVTPAGGLPIASPVAVSTQNVKLKQPNNKNDKKRQHYFSPLLVKALSAKCHVWLVGPAGGGKTTLVEDASSKLNLPYTAISVCSQTTKTDLMGYVDAHGIYRSTSFREAYEHGGVFCFDEIDNGNSNVLSVINSSLSSDATVFPDKIVNRHPNFVVVACANTFGLGASNGYVGRTQIDAATLDRFFFMEVPYDEGLESHIAGLSDTLSPQWDATGQKVPSPVDWANTVKKTREVVNKMGIKTIISPRATIMGLSLIKQGVPNQFLEKGLLFKSLSEEIVSKIKQS